MDSSLLRDQIAQNEESEPECREVAPKAQSSLAAEWAPWNPVADRDLVCDAGQAGVVPVPAPGQSVFVELATDRNLEFAFDPSTAIRSTRFGDLVLRLNDGEVVLRDYLSKLVAGDIPALTGPGQLPIDPQSLLVEPAAGTPQDDGGIGAAAADGPIGPANESHFLTDTPPPTSLSGLAYAGVIDPTALNYRVFDPTPELFPVEEGDGADGGGGGGNQPPVARNDSGTTPVDTPVTIDVLPNDTDPDDDLLTITGFTAPQNGTVTQNADGTFTYTPNPGYDGPDSFTYTIDDGNGGTSTATVDITVIPGDAPTAVDDVETTQGSATTTNLVIVFDRSSSMLQNPDVPGFATRFELAKNAVEQLLQAYAGNGPVNILIVDFAASAATSGWLTGIDAATLGTDYVNGLTTTGGTNYLAAINTVQAAYPVGAPTADNSVVYFISDGEPAPANTSLNANGAVAAWESFLAANNIDTAFAVGINSRRQDLDQAALEDIAFPNTAGDNNPILVTNEGEIQDILIDTVPPPPVTGDVDANDQYGPDGPGFIQSIDVDGTVYTFDPVALTISGGGQTIAGSVLAATTSLGGQLTFDFADGTYSYAPPKVSSNQTEQFTYVIQDSDGSTDSATLTINVRRATDRPPTVVSQTAIVPDDTAQLPPDLASTGFALLLSAPTDIDGDVLTIEITSLPAEGQLFNGSTVVTVGTELTAAEFQGLRYRPDSDGTAEALTLSYTASDGVNTVPGSVTIETVTGAPITVDGGADSERIQGTAAGDSLAGGGGVDLIVGGDGDDVLAGGAGTDRLIGGAGNDTLSGGDGDDSLAGGDGNDILVVSPGNDVISGGAGFDVLDFSDAGGPVTVDFNGGSIAGLGSGHFGGIEGVIGGDFNDQISGGAQADLIQGAAGNDTLTGRNGDDTLAGGEGADRISVSQGNDVIRFDLVADSGDSITGFDADSGGGQDVIDLDALFDKLSVDPAQRAGRVAFVDTGSNVDVRIDADGDAANGAELTLLTLVGVPSPSVLAVGEDVLVGS